MTRAARRTFLAFAVWLLLAAPALAQSGPNWTYSYVPMPAEWQFWWTHKMDYNGTGPCLLSGCTLTGPLVTPASTAIGAGLNLPPGVAPTTPNNGDVWTTSAGIFVQINGATVGPLASSAGGSFTGQQIDTGATTTSPGWYVQITGDTVPRVRLGTNATDIPSVAFGPGNANRDTFIERAGAGSLRFGAPDAASPVAQLSIVQNVVAGTSNTPGANRTFAGSQGTGTGAGGAIIFQTAPAGGAGSAQNALATALTIQSSGGLSTGAATDQGAGTLNLAGSLYNNGTAPTGTGGYVLATSPILVTPSLGVASATSLASGPITVTSASASALAVGLNGATNPAFKVDASTASSATGVTVKSAAAGGGVSIAAISSGAAEALNINALGTAGINIGNVSTGTVTVTPPVTLTSASSNSLNVGPNGATNPTLKVDDSTASAATGLQIKSAAAGGGIALTAISSGTNEGMSIAPKGSGTMTVNGLIISASAGTLTIPNNASAALIMSGNVSLTLTATGATNFTLPAGTHTGAALDVVQTYTAQQNFGTNATISGVAVSAGQYPGTTTNDNATSGNVGEYLVSDVASGAAVSLTLGTSQNVTSVVPTAGDWFVNIDACYTGTVTSTGIRTSISQTSNTENNVVGAVTSLSFNSFNPATTFDYCQSVGPYRRSLASGETDFYVARCNGSAGTCAAYGREIAWRRR